jgi:hypothetical protein
MKTAILSMIVVLCMMIGISNATIIRCDVLTITESEIENNIVTLRCDRLKTLTAGQRIKITLPRHEGACSVGCGD